MRAPPPLHKIKQLNPVQHEFPVSGPLSSNFNLHCWGLGAYVAQTCNTIYATYIADFRFVEDALPYPDSKGTNTTTR